MFERKLKLPKKIFGLTLGSPRRAPAEPAGPRREAVLSEQVTDTNVSVLTVNEFIGRKKRPRPTEPEFIAYARYLGIDPVLDTDLLWVAEEALWAKRREEALQAAKRQDNEQRKASSRRTSEEVLGPLAKARQAKTFDMDKSNERETAQAERKKANLQRRVTEGDKTDDDFDINILLMDEANVARLPFFVQVCAEELRAANERWTRRVQWDKTEGMSWVTRNDLGVCVDRIFLMDEADVARLPAYVQKCVKELRSANERFNQCLKRWPADQRTRWLRRYGTAAAKAFDGHRCS